MLRSKILVTFCVFFHVILAEKMSDEVKQMIKNLHDACTSETGATDADINAANNGDFSAEPLKCYMKCLLTTIGVMEEEDGTIDYEVYQGLLPDSMKEFALKVVDQCKPSGSNACEIAYNMNVCAYKIDPSMYTLY